jgi:hypothetical protein
LVTERLTGKDPEPYTNEYIEWGIEQEPKAREAYMAKTGLVVEEVGFVDHPILPMAGASPDGLIVPDGLIEIKCPTTATHIATLLGGDLNEKHRLQMLWQMACTGRKYCDYVSYDPRLPEEMQLFIQRVELDEEELTEIEKDVKIFLDEVDETVRALKEKYEQRH